MYHIYILDTHSLLYGYDNNMFDYLAVLYSVLLELPMY